jgi:hypothetical protein
MMMMMMMMMRQFAFQSLSRHHHHHHRAVVVVHRANSRCPHPTTTMTMRRTFASSLCSRDGAVDAGSKTRASFAFALQ